MRYPAEETAKKHERILGEAARLFRERGFSGTNVAEIMRAAELTHGGFYAHFGSKEELAAAAVGRAMAQSVERIAELSEAAPDPKRAFLDAYLSAAHCAAPGEGCAIAALGTEIARHPAARAPFTAELKRRIESLAGRFRWRGGGTARQNAIHLLSAAVGAVILARAADDPELSEEILAAVRDRLAAS